MRGTPTTRINMTVIVRLEVGSHDTNSKFWNTTASAVESVGFPRQNCWNSGVMLSSGQLP